MARDCLRMSNSRSVPPDWGPSVSLYRYIYHDNRVRFVDPDSRTVIYDVD
jgi:hypothetical protein